MASIAKRRRNGLTKPRPIWPGNARSTGSTNGCMADSAPAGPICRAGAGSSAPRGRTVFHSGPDRGAGSSRDRHTSRRCFELLTRSGPSDTLSRFATSGLQSNRERSDDTAPSTQARHLTDCCFIILDRCRAENPQISSAVSNWSTCTRHMFRCN
jgi:hypothetical protein